MLYESTRGRAPKIPFEEAIIKGIADDGGLYVPEVVPKIGPDFIDALIGMDYAESALEIVKLYAESFTDQELRYCVSRAYNSQTFDDPSVTPLRNLDDGMYIMELFHGPTSAFKDVALQLLPPLLTRSLSKTGTTETAAILVATSGDTGKAALEGFKDVPGTRVLVFYPKDGVSEIQKLQMVTQEGDNVDVAAVSGNFDDAQSGVKAIFADADVNARLRERSLRLTSANSINWGRLLPQIVYYFRAYAELIKSGAIVNGERIGFTVPTGNFGNILAGWYAREMGLPVSRFICASNSNKVLTDFINTGIYDRNREFAVTISPAMDILISSNLERLLYELSGRDAGFVTGLMNELSARGRYSAGPEIRERINELFYGGCANERETIVALQWAFKRYGYVLDTHTAVGAHVYGEYKKSAGAARTNDDGGCDQPEKMVIMATASPYKFAKDVYRAIAASESSAADERGSADADTDVVDSTDTAAGTTDSTDAAAGTTDSTDAAASSSAAEFDELAYIDLLEKLNGTAAPAALRGLREKQRLHFIEIAKTQMKATALEILLK